MVTLWKRMSACTVLQAAPAGSSLVTPTRYTASPLVATAQTNT